MSSKARGNIHLALHLYNRISNDLDPLDRPAGGEPASDDGGGAKTACGVYSVKTIASKARAATPGHKTIRGGLYRDDPDGPSDARQCRLLDWGVKLLRRRFASAESMLLPMRPGSSVE